MTEKQKATQEMTVKEFMDWFVEEYECGAVSPEQFEHTIHRLEGYALAKRGHDESFILESALTLLKDSQNLTRVIRFHGKWDG